MKASFDQNNQSPMQYGYQNNNQPSKSQWRDKSFGPRKILQRLANQVIGQEQEPEETDQQSKFLQQQGHQKHESKKKANFDIWSIKYPTGVHYNIFSVLQLLTNFGKPDISTLSVLKDSYPSYTQLTEDGNSFYRAVAITYIIQADDWSFEALFQKVRVCNMKQINPKTIPKEFLPIYTNEELVQHFREAWQGFVESSDVVDDHSIKNLLWILEKRYALDFFLILYFRALTGSAINGCKYLRTNPDLLNHLLKSALTYGSQPTSSDEIKYCSKTLGLQIYVVTIDKEYKLDTQIHKMGNFEDLILSRLPILKFMNNYHPLYTTNQVKASGNANYFKEKGQKAKIQTGQSLQNEMIQSNRTFKKQSKQAQMHKGKTKSQALDQTAVFQIKKNNNRTVINFDEIDIDGDSSEDNGESDAQYSDDDIRHNPSSVFNINNIVQWLKINISVVFRLIFAVFILVLVGLLLYRFFIEEKQWPAKEVHFYKDKFGGYQSTNKFTGSME